MTKKAKAILTGILGVLLVLFLAVCILLINIRGEFVKHLEEKYSEQSFTVGFTKIDPIYGNFYAMATCLNDHTVFPIAKSFNTKHIRDNYVQSRSQNQYNSRLDEIFKGSIIENQIGSVTGGGKMPFQNDGIYTQINIYLTEDAMHISAATDALRMLNENNISAERIIFTYEKDRHVYEILLSLDDYQLTEKELEAKVRRIK